ncbi:hypothetical protein FW764_12585 [Pseudomonas sp. 1152_12]
MQVSAMLLGGVGVMKVGAGGLWAMIERKLTGRRCNGWPATGGLQSRLNQAGQRKAGQVQLAGERHDHHHH